MNPTFDGMMGAMGLKRVKPRKCRICRQEYMPQRPMQVTCGQYECQVSYGVAVAEKSKAKREAKAKKEMAEQRKAERKATKERRKELAPLQHFKKAAEKAVNAFVRERDAEQPCISCGTNDALEWHAGHFIPVGRSSFLRYTPANIAKQCSACNVFGAGKATEFEVGLVARIGRSAVDQLKSSPRLRAWTREELEAIEAEFKTKLKELRK